MAEDSDLERTEPATGRRLEEARQKGNVPRSREMTTFAILIAAAATLLMLGEPLAKGLMLLMKRGMTFDRAALDQQDFLWNSLIHATVDMLVLFFPILLVALIAAFVAPMALGGWLISVHWNVAYIRQL